MAKRNLGRFCIQFNITDSRHLQVIDILEKQGRRKAPFIAEAILHYINCNESPEIHIHKNQDTTLFKSMIKSVVLDILQNQQSDVKNIQNMSFDSITELPNTAKLPFVDSKNDIDKELLSSIQESMSTLRK